MPANQKAAIARLLIVAGHQTMAFQKALGMKIFAYNTIIDSETPKRLKDVETSITPEIGKAHRPRTTGAGSSGKKFQCLFQGRDLPGGQFAEFTAHIRFARAGLCFAQAMRQQFSIVRIVLKEQVPQRI